MPFDNDQVDHIIRTFIEGQPNIGEVIIFAHVKGVHDIHGTRAQFRASIVRVDPDGLERRREQFGRNVERRVYDIIAPHELWHLDGWHKWVRYSMVVHACRWWDKNNIICRSK